VPTSLFTDAWAHAVVEPLGLTGFALALIFASCFLPNRNVNRPKWLWPAAFGLAGMVVLAGLTIGYKRVKAESEIRADTSQHVNKGTQTTNGPGSHNFQGVQGPITVTEHFDVPPQQLTTDSPKPKAPVHHKHSHKSTANAIPNVERQ
jgi:hypothetical protein